MLKNKLPKIIVIVGATASGKTALSLELAKRFNGEIVSADSRQIYRGMDIGTAKPTKKELKQVKHYLIDIKNPNEDYSVAQYKKDAVKAVKQVISRNKVPLLIGGTGLYIDAIVKNLNIPAVKADPQLRAQLDKEIKEKGLAFVFKKLVDLDPEAAYIVDPNNPRRIIRALEIALGSGRPFSAQRQSGQPLFDFLIIGAKQSPDVLRERIVERVHQMMDHSLVKEVRTLVNKFGSNTRAFDAIGYRELVDYLRGTLSLEEATDLMIKNTWHYARRQMTWFKKQQDIIWLDASKKSDRKITSELISKFVS